MHDDLVRGYKNFLLVSMKAYFLGRNIIQDEINFFTNKQLKDGLVFFICAFDKIDSKLFKSLTFQDYEGIQKYINISKNQTITLTKEGEKLKAALDEKLSAQAAMLEFNGIKPQHIGKVTTMFRRFEKFWQMIVTFSRRKEEIKKTADAAIDNIAKPAKKASSTAKTTKISGTKATAKKVAKKKPSTTSKKSTK